MSISPCRLAEAGLVTEGAVRLAPLLGLPRLLNRMLISGSAPGGIDLRGIAQFFTLHPRTLNRRLRAEGTTFSALLVEARFKIARQLLRDTRLQTTEIAYILGYADTASFDHAFRRWSGTTATKWRSSNRSS